MAMYLVMTAAFVLGGVLLGVGLYLTRQDDFPSWWQAWMLWPLIEVTPRVTHLQGWAAVALGVTSISGQSIQACHQLGKSSWRVR